MSFNPKFKVFKNIIKWHLMSPTWSLCLCVLEVEWVTVVSKWKGYWSVELRAYDSERERESKAAKCERCSSCTGAGHVTAPIILIGHNNAYWPSSSTDSADHPDDNECVCVYQLFIRSQYMGAAQAINVVIRRTMRTLQCNHKTNVSLVPHARTQHTPSFRNTGNEMFSCYYRDVKTHQTSEFNELI